MQPKYKLIKQHGFNPFRNKMIESLNLRMNKNKEIFNIKEIDCKQIAIIIDDNIHSVKSQTDKKGALVFQQIEIHQQNSKQTQKKKLIMFNQREYCQKQFKQIYYVNQIKRNIKKFHQELSHLLNTNQQQHSSNLLIYLSNSTKFSQQLIYGLNQTQINHHTQQQKSQFQHQLQSQSTNLLYEVYRYMLKSKNKQQLQQKTQIYFSSIGIKKQNYLYDLLNDQYLQKDRFNNIIKNIPTVKMRKIGTQIDSVQAQNLTKQIITDEQHFKQLIQKFSLIKNQFQLFHHFNTSFFIGEMYHFYQADSTYDIINQIVVLKINQSLVNDQKYEDGFYVRRMKEDYAARVSSLLMRMGLNIKNCKKNRTMMQVQLQNTTKQFKTQMHKSQILLYLSPLFCNPKTSYILINQINPTNSTLDNIVRKLQLNKSFISHKNNRTKLQQKSFFHIKHYLDNYDVLSVVKRLAVKFIPPQKEDTTIHVNNRSRTLGKILSYQYSQKKNISNTHINNQQQNFTQLQKNNPIISQRSQTNSARNGKKPHLSHSKYSEKIKSKSFFSQTIISAQRNYLKFIQRQHKKNTKSIDQKQKQKQQQGLQQQYYSKTINQRVENLKFVQDNYLTSYKPHGIRISYKRRMVVKRGQFLGNYSLI